MKSKKVWGIGMIGAGTIARKHATDLAGISRCKMIGIADPRIEAARSLADLCKIPTVTADYHDLLKNPAIDAVIVGTPPFTHRAIFIDAVKAGKHVLMEKPLGITRSDLDAMVKAAATRPSLVTCNASSRHARLQPKYGFIKKIIDSGVLGDIYLVNHVSVNRQARPGVESNAGAPWFVQKKLAGGGPSFDWGVYDLSFHLGILGDKHTLKSVCATAASGLDDLSRKNPHFDVEEHFSALMTFDKGLTYYWERATNAHSKTPNQTRICGTKGGLMFSYPSWEASEVTLYDIGKNGKAQEKVLKIPMLGHNDDNRPLMHHFLDCLDKKVKSLMPIALSAKHIDIIMKVLEAAK
jgi:predicted dehydrogenase